uniref:Ubiquitin carboxyl-terminal hydrolase n=1 Tax=Coturnix japonica TaxID=93934 RepID=A0A8C2TRA5_COTJA
DSWDKYQMGDQNVYPGPIDNSGLLKDGDSQSLKEHLIDELDYILLPTEGWNRLVSWYTLMEGQEPIARKVVEQGMFVKHCKVEVYLTELKLCENGNMNNVVTRRFSKADTIDTIEKEIRKIFNIPGEKETRLWNKYMSNTFEPLNKPDSTIQDAGLYQGQVLVIEQKNEDGTWPRGSSTPNVKNSNYCLPSYTAYKNYDYTEPGRHNEQPGLCGLSNLGNTCFMNSAIQCLSNTPPLTEYFLNDKYQEELNFDNPLGMRGEIAKSYAELIKQMWSGKYSYVTPRAFKTQVGRFAPQFSGYQQQDCQELLAFLLDGLHEDLNRIRKKPYIQLKDADGRPDKVVAEEAWENHLKRNDSIIVDIFHGLFKSTLVCPECAKISVTFDPFCYLTLPLPMKKERTLEVFLVRMDPLAKPMQYKVVVPKIGNILDLCTALSALSGVAADKMIVTDIYNHRFHRIFAMDENLSSIMERDDIYVTEDTEQVIIPVCLREKCRHTSYSHSGSSLFGQPFLIFETDFNSVLSILPHISLLNCLGEMETDEQDDESSQDQELPSENENSQSEDSVGGDNDSENGLCTEDTCKGQPLTGHKKRLFTFQFNNLGNTDINYIKDDTRHIRFDDRQPRLDGKSRGTGWAMFDCDILFSLCFHGILFPLYAAYAIGIFISFRYCPNCKEHQQATKKFDLWSLPPVLVVHLKRFSYSRYWRDKLDTLVGFPINDLDMSEFLINPNAGPCRYNLIAVSNHYGGMGGGHYTAFAKNKDDGKWYYFDDSSVSIACEDQIVSKAAYVLFYQRQDTISGTGFFPLDRETKQGASAATGIPLESDEDSNENDNDIENENCMHTN